MSEYETVSASELRVGDIVQQTDEDKPHTVQSIRQTDDGDLILHLTDGRNAFETKAADSDVRIRARP